MRQIKASTYRSDVVVDIVVGRVVLGTVAVDMVDRVITPDVAAVVVEAVDAIVVIEAKDSGCG